MQLPPRYFTRTRSSDSTIVAPGIRSIYYGPGCTVNTSSFNTGPRTGATKVIADVPTSGFKKRSGRGEIINSPCSIDSATFTSTGGEYIHKLNAFNCAVDTGGWKDSYSNLLNQRAGPLPTVPTYTLDATGLITRAATAALANVRAPEVLGAAMLYEVKKTYSSLRHPLKSLRKVLARNERLVRELNRVTHIREKLRRTGRLSFEERRYLYTHPVSRVDQGGAVAGDLSSQYLELIFGILPTMRDIQGVVDVLAEPKSQRQTARGTETTTYSSDTTSVYFTGSVITATKRDVIEETLTVRAGVLYDVSLESQLGSRLGLSAHATPAFLWEVLPWSFVVDWFTNTGDLITAFQNQLDQRYRAQWLTVSRTLTHKRSAAGEVLINGWSVVKPCDALDVGTYASYQRYPLTLGSYIGLSVTPSLDRVNVGASIALAIQQLTRR